MAVTTNLALNLALVPVLGILGAGVGPALSYVVGMGVLVLLSRRLLGWNLIKNTVLS